MSGVSHPITLSEARLLGRLDALRGELVELAFTMELRGRIEAADVASATAARLGELCAECGPAMGGEARANGVSLR